MEPDQKSLKVLLRVDLLLTFMPGGALAVPEGDKIVAVVNELSQRGGYDLVIDCRDDHPTDHGSFASQHPGTTANTSVIELFGIPQRVWPDHAVRDSEEWQFHPELDLSPVTCTIPKGQDKRVDSYSAFYDNGRHADSSLREKHPFLGQSTGLAEYIKSEAERKAAKNIIVDVCGLALGFCVSWTAIDARAERFNGRPFRVRVINDAVRALEFQTGDCTRYYAELESLGIEIVSSSQILPSTGCM